MKNITKRLFWILSIASIVYGCEKYELPVLDGATTPQFYSKGTINGTSFEWLADGSNFSVGSSYLNDDLGATIYSGMLYSAECNTAECEPKFEVQVRGTEDIDNGMKAQPYAFRFLPQSAIKESFVVTIQPEGLGDLISCEWLIDSAESYTTQNNDPLIFERSMDDPTQIYVRLTAHFSNGCTSYINDFVYLPTHGCRVDIAGNQLSSPKHLNFRAQAEGKWAYNYFWEFESGVQASSKEIQYLFNEIPSDGIETVLLMIDGDGCKAQSKLNQVLNDSLAECNINFSYKLETKTIVTDPAPAEIDLQTVEMYYTDELGNRFSSLATEQPEWSVFNITNVEDYTDPVILNHLRSKKIEVDFSVRLSHPVMGNLDFRQGRMVMPVGLGL
jgi:hypothetical protein